MPEHPGLAAVADGSRLCWFCLLHHCRAGASVEDVFRFARSAREDEFLASIVNKWTPVCIAKLDQIVPADSAALWQQTHRNDILFFQGEGRTAAGRQARSAAAFHTPHLRDPRPFEWKSASERGVDHHRLRAGTILQELDFPYVHRLIKTWADQVERDIKDWLYRAFLQWPASL